MIAQLPTFPAVPKPPDDPLHLLLNAQTGWRDLAMTHIEQSLEDCSLCLSPDPVSTRSLVDAAGTFGGLKLPTGVATDTAGRIYLLDPATGKLKRFDPCECRFEEIPCTGGIGAAFRQVANPHGIGICGGNLFICDTGNRRVQVFALKGMTLRTIWGPWKLVRENSNSHVEVAAAEWIIQTRPGECEPQALPSFPAGVWQPWDIAFDSHCRAFVTDNANGAVHRFDRHGCWQMAFGALSQPTHLAIDQNDRLYVVETGSSNVVVFDANGKELERVSHRDKIASEFCALTFTTEAKGNLYLGDLCEPKGAPPGGFRGSNPAQPALVVFDLHGNRLTPDQLKKLPVVTTVFEQEGTYLSKPLDSEIYRCQWHRVVLEGDIPDGASVKVESFTAETQLDETDPLLLPTTPWNTQLAPKEVITAQTAFALEEGRAWDCLVRSPPGRFLYLRLTFRSNGSVTPRLTSVKLFFPRISLRRYLPAVFGENPISADFTDRVLAVFDTIFRSFETTLDDFARYLDPMSTPKERAPGTFTDFLTWLASWMGVILDRSWDERRCRIFLRNAHLFHRLRGTLEGLRRQLLVYLGWTLTGKSKSCACSREIPLLILEHFKLRRWLFLGEARLGEQSVLWGKRIVNRTQLNETAQVGGTQLVGTPDPVRDPFHFYAHKFSVFIPAACVRGADRRASVERLINLAKPAHTVHQLELVEPRFRIGFQAAIGFDAVVGRYPEGFTLNQQKLGRDTVLAHSAEKKGPPSLQIGTQSRIGTTTILE
jgi:phage tail-like protein